MSIEAVQSRIAELQTRIATGFTTPEATSVSTASTDATSALSELSALNGTSTPSTGTDFASVLGTMTGTSTVAGTSATSATSAVGTATSSAGPTGQDLVAAAEKYIGTPYVWGGESLSEGGFDCSGLVLRSLTDIGAGDGVPRVAADQQTMNKGETIPSLAQAKPGDLLFFHNPASHVGIYVGNGKMIDAPHKGSTVGVHDVWTGGPSSIRRVLPSTPAQTAPVTTTASTTGTDPQVSALVSQLLASQFASTATSPATSSTALTGLA